MASFAQWQKKKTDEEETRANLAKAAQEMQGAKTAAQSAMPDWYKQDVAQAARTAEEKKAAIKATEPEWYRQTVTQAAQTAAEKTAAKKASGAGQDAGFAKWQRENSFVYQTTGRRNFATALEDLADEVTGSYASRQGKYVSPDEYKSIYGTQGQKLSSMATAAESYARDAEERGDRAAVLEYEKIGRWARSANSSLEAEQSYWENFPTEESYEDYRSALERAAYLATSQRPQTYTRENLSQYRDRVKALADTPQWTQEDAQEAAEINSVLGTMKPRDLVSEYGVEDYATWTDLQSRLGARTKPNAATGIASNFASGAGVNSLMQAISAGAEKLWGKDAQYMSRQAETFRQAGSTYAQQHPLMGTAANIAGNLVLYTSIGEVVGAALSPLSATISAPGTGLVSTAAQAAAKAPAASKAAQTLIRTAASAVNFMIGDAVRGAGEFAEGNVSGKEYGLGILKSGLTGAATGLASNLVRLGADKIINRYRLTTPLTYFTKEVASGLAGGGTYAGMGYALASKEPTSQWTAAYLMQHPEAGEAEIRQAYKDNLKKTAASQFMVGFLTTMVQSAITTARITEANKKVFGALKSVFEQQGKDTLSTLEGLEGDRRDEYLARSISNVESAQEQLWQWYNEGQEDFTLSVGERKAFNEISAYLSALRDFLAMQQGGGAEAADFAGTLGEPAGPAGAAADTQAATDLANVINGAMQQGVTAAEGTAPIEPAPAPDIPDIGPLAGAAAAGVPVQPPYTPPEEIVPPQETAPTEPVTPLEPAPAPAEAPEAPKEETPTAPKEEPAPQVKMPGEIAAELGMGENGADYFTKMMAKEPNVNPGEFLAYWNAGHAGEPFGDVETSMAGSMTPAQQKIAWNAGQMDAIKDGTARQAEELAAEAVAKPEQSGYTKPAASEPTRETVPTETVEQAKKELKAAIKMPVQGTNEQALAAGAKSGELSMDSITISGRADGFTPQQQESLIRQIIEGAGTSDRTIKVDVPLDGKFEINNTPDAIAKVLNRLKAKANQEIFFDTKTNAWLKGAQKTFIVTAGGQKFITDGYAALALTDAAAEYAQSKEGYGAEVRSGDMPVDFDKGVQVTAQPKIAILPGKGDAYIFETDSGRLVFDKRLIDRIDVKGGSIAISPFNGGKSSIAVTRTANGTVKGFVLNIRAKDIPSTNLKPGKLKSIGNGQETRVPTKAGTGVKAPAATPGPKTTTPAPKVPAAETPGSDNANDPHLTLARDLLAMIKDRANITSTDLAKLADKAFGGTRSSGAYDIKTAYDCLELAVNMYLKDSHLIAVANKNDVANAVRTEQKLQELLNRLPTQTVRTEEQELYQQFSTPPNIAYLAAWAANIGGGDVVLEPSAGIGGLALFPKAWGATVYANELSDRRASILRLLGLNEVFTENAEQIDNVLPDYVQPSVVVMNPPFSATAGRLSSNRTANAKRHIEQALDRLNDGGRLVAILGRGMSNDSKTFASWWNDLRQDYSIRANLAIDGENYKKYGTSFDVQLVVIDKTGPQQGDTITGVYKDLDRIPEVLEGIRNDRTRNEGLASAPERGGTVGKPELPAADGRGGGKRSGPPGNAERTDGGAPVDAGMAGVESPGDGGRIQPGGAVNPVQETAEGELGSRVGEGVSSAVGGAAAEPEAERENGSEPQQPLQGLSTQETNKPGKSASTNDNGVYTEYEPPKTPVTGAKKHPAVLVESAAMGAVSAPKATYKPQLPKELIASGKLSDAQITNIVYAGQAHSQMIPSQGRRKGYFIGDGTGVGKGRQISGIILDNFNQGRTKALWISKGQNLLPDAKRDWADIGGNENQVFSLSSIKADNPINADKGILFTTYDTLAAKSKTTSKSRIDQIVAWLGKDFDGVIAFDEAHNMGNLLGKKAKFGASKPSLKALAGDDLQERLPNARVVYVSATMATDVNEMAFASRLGLWGPGTQFKSVADFVQKISAGGIAAMELVARDMKAMGVYQARSISYNGVGYETLTHPLTSMQKQIYDTMSKAWQVTLRNMEKALEITNAKNNGQARAAAKSAYYSAMQRFYNQIITSMAMPSVLQDMRKRLDEGKSIVIQIVNTNEAETNRQLAVAKDKGASLDDLDITPREALIGYLKKSFPVALYEDYEDENGNIRSRPVLDSQYNPVVDRKAVAMRDKIIADVEKMSVPEGPLEMIFDAFGPEQVAEVTGRKRRIVPGKDEYGNTIRVEEKRGAQSNEADVQAFQDGKKRILIFSDAGGTGKSYHADKRAANQQQRVHYLVQAGWSAPKAVQGFGRTHRSNETSTPIYVLVTTDVRGQKRFISTIARRLDQLGALSKGQRQTGSGMFSARDNLESDLARDSLYNFYKSLIGNRIPGLDPDEILTKLGLDDKFTDKQTGMRYVPQDAGRDMETFLNRILALEYDEQNRVFEAFESVFDDAYQTALDNGTLDMGMETVRAASVEILDDTVIRTDPATGATTNYVQAKIKETAHIYKKLDDLTGAWYFRNFVGLYRKADGHVIALSKLPDKTLENGSVVKRYEWQSPQSVKRGQYVESTVKNDLTALPKKEWAAAWEEEVKNTPEYIESIRHMLTGTLLPIWNKLPDTGNVRVQRLIADDGRQYLGRIVAPSQIDGVLHNLGAKGRTKPIYTPKQVTEAVFKNGNKAILENDRVTLTRRRVGNEWRIEISGKNLWYLKNNVPDIIMEKIGYQERYFVPNGSKQLDVVTEILKLNPLKDLEEQHETSNFSEPARPSKDAGGTFSHPERWTTTRVGDADKTPMRVSDIVEKIRHDYHINITKGHVTGKKTVRGQYRPGNPGIRTREALDLPTISHELGHHLDNLYGLEDLLDGNDAALGELMAALPEGFQMGYKEKELPAEGIAEYFRRYLTNKETAAIDCPKFTKLLKETLSAADAVQLDELADEVNAYYALDADTATSSIRSIESRTMDFRTWKEKLKDTAHVLYQALIDSNDSIKRFDEEMGTGVYKFASNAAYADDRAGQLIIGDLRDIDAQYVGPGLKTVLHGLDMSNKEEYALFGEYLVVKHGPERLAEGMRIFADDRKNSTRWMKERQAAIEAEHPEFEEISDRLYEFQRQLLQTWGVDTVLVSQEAADAWLDRWKYYVPFNRAVDVESRAQGAKRGFVNQTGPYKKARGSGLDIINPVDSIIANLIKLVHLSIYNDVALQLADACQKEGAPAWWMERIPPSKVATKISTEPLKEQLRGLSKEALDTLDDDAVTAAMDGFMELILEKADDVLTQYSNRRPSGNIVTVLRAGKPEYWKVNDPQMLKTLSGMKRGTVSGVLEAYGVISRFMTSNITGRNLVWSLFSNAPRDLGPLFVYGKEKDPFKVFPAMASAYINMAKGDRADPIMLEYKAMGGGNTAAYSGDANLISRYRKQLEGRFDGNPLHWLEWVSDVVEMGPRFATYKLMRQAGMSPHEAFYEATDITVNFRRGGDISRQINRLVPFFNAGVQGADKFARWVTAQDIPKEDRKKAIFGRVLAFFAVSAALAGANYAINHLTKEREKDYERLSTYTKNSYWNIPMGDGRFFAITKPRELGVLSSYMEASLERYVAGNPHAFDEFYEYATDVFLPGGMAELAQGDWQSAVGSLGILGVSAYMMANRDFLGRPIVSQGMANLEPKLQYDNRTSVLAKAIGDTFNVSPKMTDYFFEQTLGGWWKYQRALFPVGSEQRDLTLGVKNQYIKDSLYSTDVTNRMYDRAEASKKAYNTDKTDAEKELEYKMDSRMTDFYGSYYKLAKDQPETDKTRALRGTVLQMVEDYEKTRESGQWPEIFERIKMVGAGDMGTYLPSTVNTVIKDAEGAAHELSPEQYVEYQTEYNRLYYTVVEQSVSAATTDKELAAILKGAKETAADKAKSNALKRIGAPTEDSKYGDVADTNVAIYRGLLDIADDDGSLKQAEVIDAIKQMQKENGLSRGDAYLLFKAKYDSDKNNPWAPGKK